MIQIKIANEVNAEVLALLGRVTYTESHGQYISDKNDLLNYVNTAFSVSQLTQDLKDPNNRHYIISVDGFPAGYAKLVLNKSHKNLSSKNNCLLERIYILDDFIPMKLGKKLLEFLESEVRAQKFDAIWLTVYIKNERAIKFYLKNEFKVIGTTMFQVNETNYENSVLSKSYQNE